MEDFKTLYLSREDNVAVALSDIPANTAVSIDMEGKTLELEVVEAIKFGHKFAVYFIKQGEDIKKYGEVIGAALEDIEAGSHVHVHNLEGKRGRGDKIAR